MEDSTTYQYILERGAIRELRRTLLNQGEIKFGSPVKTVEASLQELEDLSRLRRMVASLVTAASWKDLLETP